MRFYDPLYGQITVPSEFTALINTTHFRRLQFLRQLGLCVLSFPGGNHTRFEHCLGAFHLASTIAQALPSSATASPEEQRRLGVLLQLAALCHDIGHGPFSHMTENVLHGLGASCSHEDVGAALIVGPLRDLFAPFAASGVTPEMVASVITHAPSSDPIVRCVTELVSSDLDVDRLDYLHRDSHYTGVGQLFRGLLADLEDAWRLKRHGESLYFELTDAGIAFAERVLFLRRGNYQRIVYESRHMAATAMFEKATVASLEGHSAFSADLRTVVAVHLNWQDAGTRDAALASAWRVYGLVDFEAVRAIATSSPDAGYLLQRIREANLYESVFRAGWHELHYLAKQRLLAVKGARASFQLRRSLESQLATTNHIDLKHVAVHIPEIRLPRPLTLGVKDGRTLDDASDLGRFFAADAIRQYAVEVFVDRDVPRGDRDAVATVATNIFRSGTMPL